MAQIQRDAQTLYICRAVVHGNAGQCVEMVEDGESLQAARAKALASAERMFCERFIALSTASSVPTVSPSTVAPCLLTRGHANSARRLDTFNGGGSKPITPGQQELIQKIAGERRIAAAPLCHDMFGKGLSDITGAEANKIIRRMKASR